MPLPPISDPLWPVRGEPRYPPLQGMADVDVAVIGAGIAGLTTAALLVRAGRSVAVLEARTVAAGTSGRTTAKASALQGLRYQRIARHHGARGAARYARSQLDALAWMDDQVERSGVDCRWERRPALTYATTEEGKRRVEVEAEVASAAGLDVALVDAGLPLPTAGAVQLDHQAQFDPVPYLEALAAEVDGHPSGRVHEGTRVIAVHGRQAPQVVVDGGGRVRAGHVVVATLLPILDRGLFFARATPMSSYLVALRAEGELPVGMYLSADEPTRSLRTARDHVGELLLVGGEGHDTGRGSPTLPRYEALADWGAAHFPVGPVQARWSAHDHAPVDHLPWVGASSPLTPRVLVAGGFEKWGMTMGTAAGLALADHIADRPDGPSAAWADLFHPARTSVGGLAKGVELNATVAARLVADWTRPGRERTEEDHPTRRREGLTPVSAVAGTDRVEVVCTHLGGVCSWNDGDRTWDCPLHGSRFDADGSVLAGPAVSRLRRLDAGAEAP